MNNQTRPRHLKLKENFDAKGPDHIIWYLALYRPIGSIMPTLFFDEGSGIPLTAGSIEGLRDKLALSDTSGLDVFITPISVGTKEAT